MRITEVIKLNDAISNPMGRDEAIDYKSVYFDNSPVVARMRDLELRKYLSADGTDLYYGLVNSASTELVAILQLEKYKNFWQVRLAQVKEPYKSQGYGSFMYDYAVMNDRLTLLSDFSQTEGSVGGSKGLWEKLYRQGRFTVCGYNLDTDTIIPLNDSSDISSKIYNQKEDIVWMATPNKLQETIHEMLTRVNSKNKHRTIEWYGECIKDY